MARPIHILNAYSSVYHEESGPVFFTSFSILPDGSQLAVGYSTGAILMYSGSMLRASDPAAGLGPQGPTLLLVSHRYPVSGLHFTELMPGRDRDRRLRLFAVFDADFGSGLASVDGSETTFHKPPEPSIDGEDISQAGTIVFDTSMVMSSVGAYIHIPSQRHRVKVLDDRGAIRGCSSSNRGTNELVIGRQEAVYNYSVEDRGGALAVFGEKVGVCSVGRYTLLASAEERTITAQSAGLSASMNETKARKVSINIYDLKNKMIVGTSKKYQLPMNEHILFIINDGGTAYIITSSWSLIRFREKETSRKLEVLLSSKPPLYSQAILLAGEEQLDPAEIMKLYKVQALSL